MGTEAQCDRALVLVGLPGSGASTLARLVGARLGWPCLSFRGHIRDSTTIRRAGAEPAAVQELGGWLVLERGYAGLLDDELRALPPESAGVVFDDVTHPEMLQAIAARFARVLTCYVDTPADLRYERWLKQQQLAISAESLRRFQWQAASAAERRVYELRDCANHVLDGSQALEALAARVEDLIASAEAEHDDGHQ